MKSKIAIYSLSALLITSYTAPSYAGLFSSKAEPVKSSEQAPAAIDLSKYINLSVAPASNSQTIEVLKSLQTQIKDDFKNIESLMASGKSSEALILAKQNLDDVRAKLGVDPKAKLTESFYINTKFPVNAVELSQLSEDQQIMVIKTLRDFQGGYFLDILNLSKRTSLIYAKALEAEIRHSGTYNIEHWRKMLKDLALATLLPLPIIDKAGSKIVVFFDEISNEDLGYLFDNELVQYLEKNQEFKFSAADFKKYLTSTKLSLNIAKQKTMVLVTLDRAKACLKNDFTQNGREMKYYRETNGCFGTYYTQLNSYAMCLNLVTYFSTLIDTKYILATYTQKCSV